jgi:hypothetical protein
MSSDTANLFREHLVIESGFEFTLSSCFEPVSAQFRRENEEPARLLGRIEKIRETGMTLLTISLRNTHSILSTT